MTKAEIWLFCIACAVGGCYPVPSREPYTLRTTDVRAIRVGGTDHIRITKNVIPWTEAPVLKTPCEARALAAWLLEYADWHEDKIKRCGCD